MYRKDTLKNFSPIGFPKVVPTLGTTVPPVRRQSSMSVCLIPPRQSSFRQRTSPVHPHAPALVFCVSFQIFLRSGSPKNVYFIFQKRRMSWPEIDNTSTSG